jgi:prepilin-type N-terminal cleavage/methylation domain-containing protein
MRRAFTLIELLTVIAITAILMTLIIIPVVQSINLLHAGRGWSEAQERSRNVLERMSLEVTNSAGVRSNAGVNGSIAVVVPGENGDLVEVLMENMKLDVIKPSQGEPLRGPSGALINPLTGKEDPTLLTPRGQVILPAAPGASYVRYFVGLRRPYTETGRAAFYNNPYDALLMPRNGRADNLYVLYRAEFVPFVWSAQLQRYVVNTAILQDANNDGVPDDIDDPYFFTFRPPSAGVNAEMSATGVLNARGQAKLARIKAWLRHAQILTDVTRYDSILPATDRGQFVDYNGVSSPVIRRNNLPQLIPLVQFRPTRITNEPAEENAAVRQGEEGENMAQYAPDTYETKYGGWVGAVIREWPAGWNPAGNYLVGRPDKSVGGSPFRIFFYPAGGGSDLSAGTWLFDVSAYDDALNQGLRYPFSRALNNGSLANQTFRDLFVPFSYNGRNGRVYAAFGIDSVGSLVLNPPPNSPNNLPFKLINPDTPRHPNPPYTPTNDPDLAGNWYDPEFEPVNERFNKIWRDMETGALPDLRPAVHRFIDLRVTPQADGTPSPLDPDPAVGFRRAKIVPGSEQVFGPDQNPGPNYGRMTRYIRTTRTPGPNQYRINYVDVAEPDYAQLGLPNPPGAYDPNNFVSAVIQPRYKAGYLQLNSDPNVPLPSDDPSTPAANDAQIMVFYRFQMTSPDDVVAVDYDTRQLVTFLLTIRNYPQTSLPTPQTITLRSSARVRNFLR